MTITTHDEYERWRLESEQVKSIVAQIETQEGAILRELNCPTDPLAIFAILSGEQAPPWPKRTSSWGRRRAWDAMLVLLHLDTVRKQLVPDGANVCAATHAALLAGLLAGDAARNEVLAQRPLANARKGGRVRGRAISLKATEHDKEVARLEYRWKISDELQDQYRDRSPVNYICKKTKFGARTVQRALARIHDSRQ